MWVRVAHPIPVSQAPLWALSFHALLVPYSETLPASACHTPRTCLLLSSFHQPLSDWLSSYLAFPYYNFKWYVEAIDDDACAILPLKFYFLLSHLQNSICSLLDSEKGEPQNG